MSDRENYLSKIRAIYDFKKNDEWDDKRAQGEYELSEPQALAEYLSIDPLELTARQGDEFVLRMIRSFLESVDRGETPPRYVMEALAFCFEDVVRFGAKWEVAFPLPWTKTPTPLTRAKFEDRRVCELILDKHNRLIRGGAEPRITATIAEVAKEVGWGDAKAVAAWYDSGNQLKDRVLKKEHKN